MLFISAACSTFPAAFPFSRMFLPLPFSRISESLSQQNSSLLLLGQVTDCSVPLCLHKGQAESHSPTFFLCRQCSADVTSFTALDKWEQHRKHPQPVLNQLSCGSFFLFFFFFFFVVSAFHMLKCVDEIQTANISNPTYLQGAGLQSRVRPLPEQHSSLVNILILPCSSFLSCQEHSFLSTSSN